MTCEERDGMAECLAHLKCCDGESLERIARAVMHRYAELYPNQEVALMSLPKDDLEERRRCIEAIFEFLQKENLDSLG